MIRKPMKKLLRSKRGVTPVISTVILVAVAITVAVAVAYWMGGIAGQYTRFEKLEISSAYAVLLNETEWDVTINVKNTGATDATFDSVYVNGKPTDDFDPDIQWNANPGTVVSGAESIITLYINGTFTSGTTIEVKLHTAAGLDYPQMITLP